MVEREKEVLGQKRISWFGLVWSELESPSSPFSLLISEKLAKTRSEMRCFTGKKRLFFCLSLLAFVSLVWYLCYLLGCVEECLCISTSLSLTFT